MGYRNTAAALQDLRATRQVVEIDREIDPNLEAAAVVRRVHQAGGPAVFFPRVKGTDFPMLGNLFGTIERTRYLFRDTLANVRKLVDVKISPPIALTNPWKYRTLPSTALTLVPKRVRRGPILDAETTIDRLPFLKSWPDDGGPFVTLPQVYTEAPERPGIAKSNLGMYRVQLQGNEYEINREIGLHYQIHRGIGVHHSAALARGERLRVNIFIGGPPAMTVAAVMPLPEGLPELGFAGALGGRRIRLVPSSNGLVMPAEADFVIVGSVNPGATKPEGPFGDHLGYYSLRHEFPLMNVERVHHRRDAIWLFTSVGRPPQEDTSFGELIHELTGPLIPTVIPGVKSVHAVDAAGVHPLFLAVGSERYVPFMRRDRPAELITQSNAILGQGQMSLAKYLIIASCSDDPSLDCHEIGDFFRHVLERADWSNDLHFQTRTTMDTLDYSGHGLNQGSKLVIAAAGPPRRVLPSELGSGYRLPAGFDAPRVAEPGIVFIEAPSFVDEPGAAERFASEVPVEHPLNAFPMIVLCDDSEFATASRRNWLWVTFTRSNPAADVHGIGSFVEQKHWGCRGGLVIDARIKPHHAPPLVDDPEIERRVDALGAPGGPLHGII
ncbi:MAG: UbiD family decarboxylase [Isosphaeraceae bacterium]|nr:UbiD family decarboxylase [Isosphaeraceae bacterium]